MKAPVVMTLVVGLHVVVIGMIMLAQGCGATRPSEVTPPPEPVMPPRTTEAPPVEPVRPPLLPPAEPRTPPSAPQFGTYTVLRGDTLSGIAQRLGVSWRELAALNALEEPYRIVEGQPLLVPGYTGEIDLPARPEPRAEPRRPVPPPEDGYVVQSGDSLTGIGQKLGVNWRELAEVNTLAPPYAIRAGQTLRVPDRARRAQQPRTVEPPVPAPERAEAVRTPERPAEPQPSLPQLGDAEPFPYPVGEGETLASIAQFFLVSEDELRRLNDLPAPQEVRAGQRILIPSPQGD